jgi:superfamily II DNA or RNA helicase
LDLFSDQASSLESPRPDALRTLAGDTRAVARAMALFWTWRTRTATYDLLRHLGAKTESGKAFTQADVKLAQENLKRAGLLAEHGTRQGFWRLGDAVRAALYRDLLDDTPLAQLQRVLYEAVHYAPERDRYHWQIWDFDSAVAIVRLELLSGIGGKKLDELRLRVSNSLEWPRVVHEACIEAFDGATFERLDPALRWSLANEAVAAKCQSFVTEVEPVCNWALGKLDTERAEMPEYLRLQLAEALLHAGENSRVALLLADEHGGGADALRASLLVQQGKWAEAQALFEAALKQRQTETGARKRLLPPSLAWLYPLALLAQRTPRHLEMARKFCLGEAGSRNPPPHRGWGTWVHAVSVHLGDAKLAAGAFELSAAYGYPSLADVWSCLLRAWLGAEAMGAAAGPRNAGANRAKAVAALRKRLDLLGFAWLDRQVALAEAVFAGAEAPADFFALGGQEGWRAVLASLQALGGDPPAEPGASASRIVWAIGLDKRGGVETIEPLEQTRGARGWSRPKRIGLAKVAGNEKLEPWDAKVARAIRRDRSHARRYSIDRAAAIAALIGHPAAVMADAPETTVDVTEGTPEIEVALADGRYSVRVTPRPHAEPEPEAGDYRYYLDGDERRELQALRFITVLRDSPQRIRVIRFTPAQRRAAQLLSKRLAVPASAQPELQQALRSLASHFQVHADHAEHAEAAREVAAEARLRAELAPAGESLVLRLVVAPLGPEGPRLAPGAGRARVMAAIGGETVGAQRDLAAERANLDSVLAAFEFLDPPARDEVVYEWSVDDPECALALVEGLPRLDGVAAIDWPRGQQVRVVTVDVARLALRVSTERDWFRLKGRLQLDEGLVFEMQALLAAAASKSRFVPMGKGVYAALTHELRAKLADLAAVAETVGDELRVPHLAAAWLEEVLEGVEARADAEFAAKLERLRAAQDSSEAVPSGLQAELRPYQEDGYRWAMRLAQAGFGACLADDMGLGKTIQTLAVLLARAGNGPALVVAPTSVCGNWLAETRRFAPSLNALPYGEGDRAALVKSAGARDVIVVSYGLMQQAREAFAARTWHTLVADEAQLVKNAAAKRSLALFDLAADLRIALSGTPVENRLAELWSIMRFCNPGLLGPFSRFNERFAGPIERRDPEGRHRDVQRTLRRLISPFVLRRTKAQVLQDLPPRTELVLTIEPEPPEAAHYEALRRTALAAAEKAVASDQPGQAQFHVLAQLTRLRRAACDPRLVNPEAGFAGAKVRAFAELAAELVANGHKALVFSQFVDFLTLLRVPLDEAGIRYQYLDGSTPAAERGRRVAAFQAGEGELFLISLKAGGYGLNLTAADYVVITDPWWNPAAEDQAMGRAHRIGQPRPVTVYRLVGKGTLEERIVELHHDKRALAEGVLGEQLAGAPPPSAAELISLMRGG